MIHISCKGKTEKGYKIEEFFIPESTYYDFIDWSGTFDSTGEISNVRDLWEGCGDVIQKSHSRFVFKYPVNNVIFNTNWDVVDSDIQGFPKPMAVHIGYTDTNFKKDYSVTFLATRIGRGYSFTPFEAFEPYLDKKECMTND